MSVAELPAILLRKDLADAVRFRSQSESLAQSA